MLSKSKTVYSLFNIHYSIFIIQYSLFNTHYSILIIQYSLFNIHYQYSLSIFIEVFIEVICNFGIFCYDFIIFNKKICFCIFSSCWKISMFNFKYDKGKSLRRGARILILYFRWRDGPGGWRAGGWRAGGWRAGGWRAGGWFFMFLPVSGRLRHFIENVTG